MMGRGWTVVTHAIRDFKWLRLITLSYWNAWDWVHMGEEDCSRVNGRRQMIYLHNK